MSNNRTSSLRVAGLFAGIGGIELGFNASGLSTDLLCEIEPGAQAVLRSHFPGVPLAGDVKTLKALPPVDVVVAGFPCQDLSQAGRTAGIGGKQSGLVEEVFRLLRNKKRRPTWLVLENVPFMLQLDRGGAMDSLVASLEALGFRWAYRVVDAQSFGLPQRRKRVLLVASCTEDPRGVLFADEAGEPPVMAEYRKVACGFYWTEGLRGLGWAVDSVPTLKGGSTIGIPSPPAIWMPDGKVVTPEIRDAERLQGFPVNWTLPAVEVNGSRRSVRWKLVGNAVSVPMATWLGSRLRTPGVSAANERRRVARERWPNAGWGHNGRSYVVDISTWPRSKPGAHLHEFLQFPTSLLSERATAGFLSRARQASLRFPEGFIDAVSSHLRLMERSRIEKPRAVA